MAVITTLVLLSWITITNAIPGTGRGFVGRVDPEDSGMIKLDKATSDALQSGLTTVFLPIVYIFVFVVALPTNAMAIWVFVFRTKKKHPSSIYMANLALSDLLFVIWIPLKISYHLNGNDWIYGEAMCKLYVSFFYGNMYCSVLFIASLSMQRYWVVAHPLSQQRKNNKMAVIVSACIWAFIWLSTTPLYLYEHTAHLADLNITTCHDVSVIHDSKDPFPSVQYPYYYFMFTALVVFLVPCVLIVVAYVLLLRSLDSSMGDGAAGKNRRRAVQLIATVLLTFLLCFLPSNIMLVVHYSLLKDGSENNFYAFYVTALCLSSLNSCLDPFIYYFVSEDFRDHVKNTLLCRSSRTVERMRVSFSSLKYSRKSQAYMSDSGNTQSSSC
ncbi:coagulation factor II (thrombin) receptor-like 1, tandem duplicate 2 [Gadus chalcogrammus]|uniref:coagulation factor II (thrombin) receptor-like 1, tandem duplicate 2 n=1 Tax=Gadus chalcogrammus TaxID=1042646 RepID=UPI0024C464E6|nr:coagulation factor II (thrombin) receptor-like 1, tandem duplicate 2 [Gadus chalcogrammus]